MPPGSSTVEIELEPDGDGTLLRFTHRDLPSAEAAESHSNGWDHYLERCGSRQAATPASIPGSAARCRKERGMGKHVLAYKGGGMPRPTRSARRDGGLGRGSAWLEQRRRRVGGSVGFTGCSSHAQLGLPVLDVLRTCSSSAFSATVADTRPLQPAKPADRRAPRFCLEMVPSPP